MPGDDLMPDPEIKTLIESQCYQQQQPGRRYPREFDRESLKGLQKSLTQAHDRLAKQISINTRLNAQLAADERTVRMLSWILGTATASAVAAVLKAFFFALK
jgi:hypothetical protein